MYSRGADAASAYHASLRRERAADWCMTALIGPFSAGGHFIPLFLL
jgi:hypothetical protein